MELQSEKLELIGMLLKTDSADVLKKIRTLLKRSALDETDHLLSSKANRKHLDESIAQANAGATTTIPIKDLWK